MKCANCSKDAMYEYRVTNQRSVFYCGKDLPRFLKDRKDAGLLPLTPTHSAELESALSAVSVTVPIVEEEPAPKKKATKKKAE